MNLLSHNDTANAVLMPVSIQWPEGLLVPLWSAPDFCARWHIRIEFGKGADGKAGNVHYQQLVRGFFRLNGKLRPHHIGQQRLLSQIEWQEDGFENSAYGHPQHQGRHNGYNADGSVFEAIDAPGFTNLKKGDFAEMDLQFRGQLVETRSGNVICSQEWRVKGAHYVR